MKNKFLFLLAALLFIGGIHATAQTTLQPRNYFKVLASAGSIVNTEADTLTLSGLDMDKATYRYNYAITRTNVSGTTNVTVILQESNETSGTTNWYTVATASGTGATTTFIQAAQNYGPRHRIILTGAGTQSTTYRVTARLTKL